ncbi:hypothetical protein TanjilG_24061 [Lupinus angustifolius]|uniref:PAP/OAS1 substrate-binding-related domain-containing protein n=1 Tax=Lupinus angustifolius TaxID=3871 RepID=A0A1J7H816_LUPAN|nr:hypothetical protein TanjilG_24061 [Lupinus angustifolius]
MGDLHVNADDRFCSSSPPSPPLPSSHVDPSSVRPAAWSVAEKAIRQILCRIQPTLAADRRRREVVDYVQRLIRYGARCEVISKALKVQSLLNQKSMPKVPEVFPYGSVPLKTYLPDGDIDLTALSYQSIEDGLVSDVHAVLRGEEANEAAEYEVKDIRFIDAEVKLVKCIVQNIVVDISFNQLGGLSTLCFLEKVDRLVGKDHLFKRSIILIKAWCYYESRILGAHHGLISTYALETLVLYIFHHFHHVSLDSPLAVLFRFLEYFSKFDWDNYFVSLKGPVGKSSIPDIVAERPENGGNTLLTEEFIRSCVDSFSVPSRGVDLNLRAFPQKHLNIIDPLKENNNLGRSVNRAERPENGGNTLLTEEFIRSCVDSFSVPSRGVDLNLRAFPQKHLNIIDPLKENNNLGRSVNRGNFYRIRSAFKYGARKLGWILMLPEDRITDELNKFFANTPDGHVGNQGNDMQTPSMDHSFDFSCSSDTQLCYEDNMSFCLSTGSKKDWIPENQHNFVRSEREKYLGKDVSSLAGLSLDSFQVGNVVRTYKHSGNSNNVTTSGVLGVASTNSSSYCSNGKVENRISCRDTAVKSVIDDEKEKYFMVSNSRRSRVDESNMPSFGSTVLENTANFSESSFCHSDRYTTSVPVGTEASKSLLDLAGDYESNIRNLQYGQMCNGYTISPLLVPSPPSPRSPEIQNRNPWETVRQHLQINHSVHPQTNSNGVIGQQFYLVNHPTLPLATFGSEEKRKPRGTGAYFPTMTSRTYRDNRPVPGRGRSQVPGTHGLPQRHIRSNGFAPTPQEWNLSSEGSSELSVEGYPAPSSAKARSSETYFFQPSMWGSHSANGFPHSSENQESGSVSPQLHGSPRTEVSSHLESGISASGCLPDIGIAPEERSNALPVVDRKRIGVDAYRLKNEDDFPPLSL